MPNNNDYDQALFNIHESLDDLTQTLKEFNEKFDEKLNTLTQSMQIAQDRLDELTATVKQECRVKQTLTPDQKEALTQMEGEKADSFSKGEIDNQVI